MAFLEDSGSVSPRFYGGRMLLAMPGMFDENFRRAAIVMCVHDEHGAMGIDIGGAVEGLSLAELLASFEIDGSAHGHVPVMRGGPVEPQRGFVLHGNDWSGQDATMVSPEWSLSGSLDILRAIAEGRGPSRYIVALGYSGWGAGQLEHEMTTHGWFLGGPVPENLAHINPGKRWDACFAECGIDTRMLAAGAGLA